MDKVAQFIEERTGLVGIWRKFADHPVPAGHALRGILPAVLVYLFIQQAVIGILLALHYSPSATDAWASTVYLNDQLAAGWFLRGLHYHGTSVMVVAAVLYLGQLAVTGMYKRPREGVWVATILLLLVTMFLGVTGNVLPWDEQGYWSIQVELGIAEQTPGGEALRTVIQGGNDSGNFLLTRLYTIHALLLPGAAVALLAAIVVLGRRAQLGDASTSGQSQPFFPSQAFFNVMAMGAVAALLVVMTMQTHGSELFGPADPTSGFQARPEWYFLPLFKLRMFFEGPLEPIATMVIPGAAGGFVLMAPFIDAKLGALGRKVVLGALGLMMAGVVALTALSISDDAANESLQEAMKVAYEDAEKARALAREGVPPAGGPAVWENDPAFKLKALFKEHCATCHMIEGRGGTEAPDLTDYGSRAWLTGVVRNPKDPRFFGGTKHDTMDPYPESDVSNDQMQQIVEYLVELSGAPADADMAAKGKALVIDELDCNGCHEVEAGSDSEGPTLAWRGSTDWVARVIADPTAADLFGEAAEMPKFKDKLSEEEIGQLAAYVTAQNSDPGAGQKGDNPPKPAPPPKPEGEGEGEGDEGEGDEGDGDGDAAPADGDAAPAEGDAAPDAGGSGAADAAEATPDGAGSGG